MPLIIPPLCCYTTLFHISINYTLIVLPVTLRGNLQQPIKLRLWDVGENMYTLWKPSWSQGISQVWGKSQVSVVEATILTDVKLPQSIIKNHST